MKAYKKWRTENRRGFMGFRVGCCSHHSGKPKTLKSGATKTAHWITHKQDPDAPSFRIPGTTWHTYEHPDGHVEHKFGSLVMVGAEKQRLMWNAAARAASKVVGFNIDKYTDAMMLG